MPSQLLTCASCAKASPLLSDTPVLELSPVWSTPALLKDTAVATGSMVIHEQCYKEIRKHLASCDELEAYRRIHNLAFSKSAIWMLPSDFAHDWTAQLAGRSFCNALRNYCVQDFFRDLKKKAMPDEIMQMIGELSFPCAMTDALVLHENLLAIFSMGRKSYRWRKMNASGSIVAAYAQRMQHKYVVEVDTVRNVLEGGTLIVCSDGVACRYLGIAERQVLQKGVWYRKLLIDPGDEILIIYKVTFYRFICVDSR